MNTGTDLHGFRATRVRAFFAGGRVMTEFTTELVVEACRRALVELPEGQRLVVAVAGVPGSGKSTLCAKVADVLNGKGPEGALRPGFARVVPMDGFHLPNAVLDERGLRGRKGSPESFDVAAFRETVIRLRECRERVVFPIYDRELHEPVLRDVPERRVEADCRVVLVEGNYVLLDDPNWKGMGWVWGLRVFVNVAPERARQDIIARHVRGGRSEEDAQKHYERNDLPNSRRVLEGMMRVDYVVGR
jgi:pantothenate kinase